MCAVFSATVWVLPRFVPEYAGFPLAVAAILYGALLAVLIGSLLLLASGGAAWGIHRVLSRSAPTAPSAATEIGNVVSRLAPEPSAAPALVEAPAPAPAPVPESASAEPATAPVSRASLARTARPKSEVSAKEKAPAASAAPAATPDTRAVVPKVQQEWK